MTETLVGTPDPEEPASNVSQFPVSNTFNSTYQYYPQSGPVETTHETVEREYDEQGRVVKETKTTTTTRTTRTVPASPTWTTPVIWSRTAGMLYYGGGAGA